MAFSPWLLGSIDSALVVRGNTILVCKAVHPIAARNQADKGKEPGTRFSLHWHTNHLQLNYSWIPKISTFSQL